MGVRGRGGAGLMLTRGALPRCLLAGRALARERIILIPRPSDLLNASKNKPVTMTTLLQRVSISKINLSVQPLYFVLLMCTLSSLS